MVQYSYQLQDLATGQPLGDLPLSCSQGLPRAISSDASTTFTLDIGDPKVRNLTPEAITRPGRTALFALREDVPVWGGIIWGRSYKAATGTITIQASTVESYWRHRYWAKGRWYLAIDQFLIAAGAILGWRPVAATATTWILADGTTVVGDANSAIGTVTDSDGVPVTVNVGPYGLQSSYSWNGGSVNGPACGVVRSLAMLPGKNVYDGLVEMMNLDNGFEWTCDPIALANGTYGWASRFGYPQLGRFEDETGLQFDFQQGLYDRQARRYLPGLASNILDYDYSDDATSGADRAIVTGAETDAYIPYTVRGDLRLLRAGYPLLEVGTNYSDVSDDGTLDARAHGDLTDAALPTQLGSWTVRADGDVGFGTFQMGDRAVFNVSDLFTPQQASGLPGRMSVERIVGWNLVPEERGQPERVALTTNPIDQPSARLPKSEARRLEQFERRLAGQAITAAQGNSTTPVTISNPAFVLIPNGQANSVPGATVTITDLALTKTKAAVTLTVNGYESPGAVSSFLNYTVLDVDSGAVVDTGTIAASSDPNLGWSGGGATSLGMYDYGDRIHLRVTCYMTGSGGSDPFVGSTYFRVQSAQLTN